MATRSGWENLSCSPLNFHDTKGDAHTQLNTRDIKDASWPLEGAYATFFMFLEHTFKDWGDLVKNIQQIEMEKRNTKSHTLKNTQDK